ncbi:MAG: hypothetical protein AVDCRST_MAG78-1086, partial [uncultured Rubrobacteraceae bacterium]
GRSCLGHGGGLPAPRRLRRPRGALGLALALQRPTGHDREDRGQAKRRALWLGRHAFDFGRSRTLGRRGRV